jgi:hypothetical protein
MSMEKLLENLAFCDPQCVIVITHDGRLLKIWCPFNVKCIHPVGNISLNRKVFVEGVKSTLQDQLVYIINGSAYFHYYFRITHKS